MQSTNLNSVSCSAKIFSVPMPMMMSVSDLGLLGLMLNILMTPNLLLLLDRRSHLCWCMILFALRWWIKVKPDAGRWFKRHWIHIREMFAACTI
ncbi:hypothetical protein ABKV19_027372 [Rosa sericea]